MPESRTELANFFWCLPEDSLVDCKTVAAATGHSLRWFRFRLAAREAPPHIRLSKRLLFRKADVRAWIAEHRKV